MARKVIFDFSPGYFRNRTISTRERLLSLIRYNRLIDIFLGLSAFSLQTHSKVTLRTIGEIKTDEIYFGISNTNRKFVIPVQAKGGKDQIRAVQVEQDLALCRAKYPHLTPRPVAVQFIRDDDGEVIVMIELSDIDGSIKVECERHYRLVPSSEIGSEELRGTIIE